MDGETPDLQLPHITICGLGAVRSYSRQEDDIPHTADVSVPEIHRIDDGYFSFGTVVRVEGDSFAILEYVFATDTFLEQTYRVKSATEYGNSRCLADLREGDSVVIDYEFDGNCRVASDEDDDLPPDQ